MKKDKFCTWENSSDGAWLTGCGKKFVFQMGAYYCHGCGKPIRCIEKYVAKPKEQQMEKINIKKRHNFNLNETYKIGDWFLGCSKCWYRLGVGEAAYPYCPICKTRMHIFTITEDEISEAKGGQP